MIDNTAVMQQALDVLMSSLDSVYLAHTDAINLYSGYPLLERKITALKNDVDTHEAAVAALQQAIAQPVEPAQEQNFCPRCGKRLGGIDDIHTCTPSVKPVQPTSTTPSEPVAWMWEVLPDSPISKHKGDNCGAYFENPADIGIDINCESQAKNYKWTPLYTSSNNAQSKAQP